MRRRRQHDANRQVGETITTVRKAFARDLQKFFVATIAGPSTLVDPDTGDVLANHVQIFRTGEEKADGGSYLVLGGFPTSEYGAPGGPKKGQQVLALEVSPFNAVIMGTVGSRPKPPAGAGPLVWTSPASLMDGDTSIAFYPPHAGTISEFSFSVQSLDPDGDPAVVDLLLGGISIATATLVATGGDNWSPIVSLNQSYDDREKIEVQVTTVGCASGVGGPANILAYIQTTNCAGGWSGKNTL